MKGAIPQDRAKAYQQKAFDWVKSFGTAFDHTKPETWTKDNLPVQSLINTFSAYGVSHEKFMWDARMEPGVLAAFAELWGTDELLVSFDALNITFPNRADKPKREPWPHIDQSPLRRGLQCAQGVINLSQSGPEDGGLLVYPDSHALMEEFFETQTDKETWEVKDGYGFTEEQVKWFTDRGIKTHKICADPGDLLTGIPGLSTGELNPRRKAILSGRSSTPHMLPLPWRAPRRLRRKLRFSTHGSRRHTGRMITLFSRRRMLFWTMAPWIRDRGTSPSTSQSSLINC